MYSSIFTLITRTIRWIFKFQLTIARVLNDNQVDLLLAARDSGRRR